MAFASRLLPGKVVAITGCSTGIGRAVAIGTSLLPYTVF
jgi:NADP-dependent 3-hydroxy acid dehydrogenase YdfG